MADYRTDESRDWEIERQEWLDSIDSIQERYGAGGVKEILRLLQNQALSHDIQVNEATLNTPYRNTIPPLEEPAYPGNIELEERIEKLLRWNAAAMIVRAADTGDGLGGHIATYTSAATMMEVGLNHVFRARSQDYGGDLVIFQPHASPGTYARAFLEGRMSAEHLDNFRRQLAPEGGLSSYPHPRSMPDFWQVPCASMGLSTPTAIYQARFCKYLENRALKPRNGGKVWCFIGDGEADEPEVLGTINIASRERLDNLVLVVNCNLQRLDGPVRGNGKIIQELERAFRGADWNVIKVIWGSGWDPLFARDTNGVLQKRMDDAVDGDYQYLSTSEGDVQRDLWVQDNAELSALMKTLSDDEVRSIRRGGQDAKKVYAAYRRAEQSDGKPTVILIKSVKGYGLGKGQGRNTAHQKKQLSREERLALAHDCNIPLSEAAIKDAQYYLPPADSPELTYIRERRAALGGFIPQRTVRCPQLSVPDWKTFDQWLGGSGEHAVSTTMVMVRMLGRLMKDAQIGKYIVPIVPDEARTFGLEALFKNAGIYSPDGQRYTPVDGASLLPYKEEKDGQILQEGICETGAMASFLAAGTAYAVHGIPTVPFYMFYSMFGFQRVGDMIWSCADMMCRGFLLGGTAGRTTLNGEGMQHQDGHSQLVAGTIPSLLSYDPAFAHEIAIIVRDGIRRMYVEQEDVFYYLTLYNENYTMPAIDNVRTVEEGVLRGMYRLHGSSANTPAKVHLLGAGSIIQQVLQAKTLLAERGIAVDVWSVTSFNLLCRDAMETERWNRLHPEEKPRTAYLQRTLAGEQGVFVAVTDYVKALPNSIAPWIPGEYTVLGTDGYGLSEAREALRDHFEISPQHIVIAALQTLAKAGQSGSQSVRRAIEEFSGAVRPQPTTDIKHGTG
ncbi:MAG: pyruvate dehydrogenase (acetyl-transferring), homodimeric type [Gammaproteobacteria bacterium]|nr:pyruvate dehydrogenase (acetyl-transferring), homodimeric type [Gammaproteobacteria bacterium]